MWDFLKKRKEGDLRRLISAYRFYLKAVYQTENHGPLGGADQKWKGGFGKAFNQIFRQWPTPNESKRFDKLMRRWLKKADDPDRAFILAFNDFLHQKRLTPGEMQEVLEQGRQAFGV